MIYRTASIIAGVITVDPNSAEMDWDTTFAELTKCLKNVRHLEHERLYAENNQLTHIVGCIDLDDGNSECFSSTAPTTMIFSELVGSAYSNVVIGAELYVGTIT